MLYIWRISQLNLPSNLETANLLGHRYIGQYLAKKYIGNDNPYKKEVNDMLVEIKKSELPSLVQLEARGEAKAEIYKNQIKFMIEKMGLNVEQVEEKMLVFAEENNISINTAKSLIDEAKADLAARGIIQ